MEIYLISHCVALTQHGVKELYEDGVRIALVTKVGKFVPPKPLAPEIKIPAHTFCTDMLYPRSSSLLFLLLFFRCQHWRIAMNHLLTLLLYAVNNKLCSDIIFLCSTNQVIYAHRVLLLCSGCQDFMSLVENKQTNFLFTSIKEQESKDQGSFLEVKVDDSIHHDVLRSIIEFLYTGIVTFDNMSMDPVQFMKQITELADKLHMNDLQEMLKCVPASTQSCSLMQSGGLTSSWKFAPQIAYKQAEVVTEHLRITKLNKPLFSDGRQVHHCSSRQYNLWWRTKRCSLIASFCVQ